LELYRPSAFLTIFLLSLQEEIITLYVITYCYLPFGLANCLVPAQGLNTLVSSTQLFFN
jgi:hypothetical protein